MLNHNKHNFSILPRDMEKWGTVREGVKKCCITVGSILQTLIFYKYILVKEIFFHKRIEKD